MAELGTQQARSADGVAGARPPAGLPDLAAVDIESDDLYTDGPPWALFDDLRERLPVFRHEGRNAKDVDWFWAVLRHDDIQEVSRVWQTYSSARGGSLIYKERPDMEQFRMLLDMDPPEHTRNRKLVSRGFTPRAIGMLADHYVEVTNRLVDEAMSAGEVEFVAKVATELPLIAITEMLGIPVEDRSRIFDWSNRMIATTDPDYSRGEEDALEASLELYMYAQELAADRRAHPRDDIISILVSAEDGDQLSEHEFNLFVLLLAVAGNETTRNAISHGMIAMAEHPDQWDRLRADPSLLDSAVEEILRWGSPVNLFRRTAQCDVEIRGQHIHEGDPVVMFYASANRDPQVFPDPYRFDIGRDPNPHLTFGGGGPHFCLGANLARLEMRALFGQLAHRCQRIEVTGEVRRLRSSFVNGVKTLPVRLA